MNKGTDRQHKPMIKFTLIRVSNERTFSDEIQNV